MPVQRKKKQSYSLADTMADAKANIESSKNVSLPEDTSMPVSEPAVAPEPEKPLMPILEKKEEVSPVELPTLSVSEKPEIEIKKSLPISKKKKSKKTDAPFIDEDTTRKTNVRNVELDDETLWRLDQVKDKLNRSRAEGEPLVTQKTIMSKALTEWLDKYYPNTKEAYHFINNLD